MKRVEFKVTLAGYGETVEKAWEDATEQFSLEPGPPPEEYEVEDEDEDRCCVCGKFPEADDVCECVCPKCGVHCYNDVTISDHGMCIDCHKKWQIGEDGEEEEPRRDQD